MEDETDQTAMIAVQGPQAVARVLPLSDAPDSLRALSAFGVAPSLIAGVRCFVARSGYTGEDGFEIVCSASEATLLWDALLQAGIVPCGLASRDTLRVEAGLPLYGHELADDISPIEAGLGWVVSKTKTFIGSEAINTVRDQGPARKIQGIRLQTKRLLLPEMPVYQGDESIGFITSGVYSPVLECGIGFALLAARVKLKTEVEIDIRGKREPATVVSKRFYKRAELES
jgi:aminomethyltransferase